MQTRRRALIAAQPNAYAVLKPMLSGAMDVLGANTIPDALSVLSQNRGRVDIIICTIAFDESRLIEFLQAVKQNPSASGIPFLCLRVFPTVFSDHLLLDSMRTACIELGAVDLIDLADLAGDAAQNAVKAGIARCLSTP